MRHILTLIVTLQLPLMLVLPYQAAFAEVPYYGGFGTGFLRCFDNGAYGKGEIRSGDLGVKFFGPDFGGPYWARMHVTDGTREWSADLSGSTSGMRVSYDPLFPICRYGFSHTNLPVEVSCDVFAPWIPGDSRLCSMPVLFFEYRLHNPGAVKQRLSIAFEVPNPEADSGQPVRDEKGGVVGVLLNSKRAGGGTLCGMVRNDGEAQTSWGGNFSKGALDGKAGNLLASSIVVPPNATRRVVFALAWDFPVYISGGSGGWPRQELGHYHSNFYQGADAVARDGCDRYPAIRTDLDGWFRRMTDASNLPGWLQRQILISTSHMVYNGVFFKNGQAAMKEGSSYPSVGTYDEHFFGSVCQLIFLPEADWGTLEMFAAVPTPDGAIRHDLGEMCVTATGTSPNHDYRHGPWRPGRQGYWNSGDNTPEWILDLYRDYLWTGDLARLKSLWPVVQKGCDYMLAGDKDDNGLYDDGKTYDCFARIPENMYINDLQRASFQAAAVIAKLAGDKERSDAYDARSRRMAAAMEQLWNPKGFYSAGRSQPENADSTGLLGEHSDDLLGLPRQLDEERVAKHLKRMGTLGHNFNGTTFQVMDHDAKGERSDIVGSKIPETIMSNAEGLRAYAALAIWRGLPEEGMIVAKCFYDVIFEYLKRPWNQPMLITKERKPIFGDHYQSIPAAWHLLLALEGLAWDVPAKKLSLRPNLPDAFQGKLNAFLPGAVAWGWLDYSSAEPDCDQKLILTFQRPFELQRLGVKNTGRAKVSATRGGKTVPCTVLVQGKHEYEISFDPALRLDDTPVEIRVGGAQ